MSIRDSQREKVIERLAGHLLDTGLAETSLRQLAAAATVSDRMLLYYFADKAEVLAAAMARIAAQMADRLAAAVPEGAALPPRELVVLAAQITAQSDMRQPMRLWVEVIAAAARGEEPFVAIAGQVIGGFRIWLGSRLALPAGETREAVAGTIIALIDGLALVDICSTPAQSLAMRAALPALFAGPDSA